MTTNKAQMQELQAVTTRRHAVNDPIVWVVVPVRSLRNGKTRLAPALDVAHRTALLQWLLGHTLEQAAVFPGLSRTLVVTGCPDVSAWVTSRGVCVLEEAQPAGLNGALTHAQSTVLALGAARMLVVASDLPLLRADDLRDLAHAASETTVSLAPDRTDQGTNALCLPADRRFDFAFGPDSFARHCEHAARLGLTTVALRRRGLAFDVDLPRDLLELEQLAVRIT